MQTPCNLTRPAIKRIHKDNIRLGPADTTIATMQKSATYQRQLSIDEREAVSAAKRLPPVKCKPAAATTSTTTLTVGLNRSSLAALPNAIDVEPIEYILDALEICLSPMWLMPNSMDSLILIRLYSKMFTEFARQELNSSPISTVDDLAGSSNRALAAWLCRVTAYPHETI